MDYLKKDQDRRQAVIMNHAYHNGEYDEANMWHIAFWGLVALAIIISLL